MAVSPSRRRVLAALGGLGLPWCPTVDTACAAQHSISPRRAWVRLEVGRSVLRAAVPDHFLSFNLNSVSLDSDHWSDAAGAPRPDLVTAMRAFPGAYLRYPGGNLSNHFASDWAVGPVADRRPQRLIEHAAALPVRFGPREYFDLVRAAGARSWYTLNLVGWDDERHGVERPSSECAAANGRLAALRRQLDPTPGPRWYHLGNELDRNRYQWPVDRYLQRCRETMAAVRAADPEARFVAFLRDFDLGLRAAGGPPRGIDHAAQVLDGLPDVADASLQVYYDRAAGEGQRSDLTWRWGLIDRFLSALPRRAGRPVAVWITEHAQARDLQVREGPRRQKLASTSGIGGAVASADFVLGALRRPAIQAAFWHAVGGGVWWDLFEPGPGALMPTPAYHAFRLLREHLAGAVMDCEVRSSDGGTYAGGYDVNATALQDAPHHWTVLVANRAPDPADLTLVLPDAADRRLRVTLHTVSAAAPATGDNADELRAVTEQAAPFTITADRASRVTAAVPARCVAVLRLAPDDTTGG